MIVSLRREGSRWMAGKPLGVTHVSVSEPQVGDVNKLGCGNRDVLRF